MAITYPLTAIDPSDRDRLLAEATEIFFATANTSAFNSPIVKKAFYQRWFGNYLDLQPLSFFLALDNERHAVGYLAGCLDSFSDESRPILDGMAFYTKNFRAALQDFPSHLHINVKPGQQGRGIGSLLVARFFEQCIEARSPGVHVVTGANSRAVQFYENCGFRRFFPLREVSPDLGLLVHRFEPS
ncbi:GNAT family N-acetyltransferase [Rhodomicrobium lacus]|uniref:GNAT family N-acetyltransferase n=1 Tax=Rhodomicrobium TaxID=1068 RepID=UPI000F8D68A9|nr:GNAT family N-acetyltransferase [Rhodomicrobium lacus]WKW49471.1 GNAT family N-acetyltransferase [Rhodomicrobium lacus]